jgi:hypothetical protein
MNSYYTPSAPKITIYGIVILCGFLAMALIVRRMYRHHDAGRVNSGRAVERAKARQEIASASAESLSKAGWVDQNKGIVRLPIQRAMELTVQGYQNPGAAHSNLVARSQKAAVPAPPQQFE